MLSVHEPWLIRALSPNDDVIAVGDLYSRSADYVMLETGCAPDDDTVDAFFSDCPPNADPATSQKLGVVSGDGKLIAIADMAYGYPDLRDAYIGLMLIDPRYRGQGLGCRLLGHLMDTARTNDAHRMLVAVLEENVRGLAFWMREGFQLEQTFPATAIGGKSHIRHRLQKLLQ